MFVGVPDGADVDLIETNADGQQFITLNLARSQSTGLPTFFPNTGGKTYGKNKMYLRMPAYLLPEYANEEAVRNFSLGVVFVDETTGVGDALRFNDKGQMTNGKWGVYDLQGRQITNTQLPKGLYIVGGKKFVVK
jgi:hypothetical protein